MRELIDMKISGDNVTVLAKDIQQHVTRGDLIHIDFYEVNMKETIRLEVDLVVVGEAPTSVTGVGSLTLATHSLEIECLPGNLVSALEVDFSRIMSLDDTLYAKDLTLPEGLTLISDEETALTNFTYFRSEEEEEEEEDLLFGDSAEVEVIARGKDEEEEDF